MHLHASARKSESKVSTGTVSVSSGPTRYSSITLASAPPYPRALLPKPAAFSLP